MPVSSRRLPIPPTETPPPDRFVTGMEVDGLFGSSNAHIAFGRNKNFLIGPNGSGKTTIVHILASCLRNDFTQLFELPFRATAITLRSISNSTNTKIMVQKDFNPQTGRRTIRVEI
jgi:predicted ATP-binding protein involved in virulence